MVVTTRRGTKKNKNSESVSSKSSKKKRKRENDNKGESSQRGTKTTIALRRGKKIRIKYASPHEEDPTQKTVDDLDRTEDRGDQSEGGVKGNETSLAVADEVEEDKEEEKEKEQEDEELEDEDQEDEDQGDEDQEDEDQEDEDQGDEEESEEAHSRTLETSEDSEKTTDQHHDISSQHPEEAREDEGLSQNLGETEALRPMDMYFPPSEYKKRFKVGTRCFMDDFLTTLKNLDPPASDKEKKWFEQHPQFKHLFHMPLDKNHKVQGMWMLILRTTKIERKWEAWFVVNGVPIRYGLTEHALISGLDCRNYPPYYKKLGGTKFVTKYFGKGVVRFEDVKAKLDEMEEAGRDRLKMLVLLFLCSVLITQTKCSGKKATPVSPFLLRAVDDLKLCKTFPWGRLSFDYMLSQIKHTVEHFGGVVKEGGQWPIPGFCLPLELLPFEAIPDLRNKFREDVADADEDCPRMCQTRFKSCEMKGFPLSKINEELGTTKDIDSIMLARNDGEKALLLRLTEENDDVDTHDIVVESWMKLLGQGLTVCFEDMHQADVAARRPDPEPLGEPETDPVAAILPTGPGHSAIEQILNKFQKEMEEQMKTVVTTVKGFDGRLATVEASVKELKEKTV